MQDYLLLVLLILPFLTSGGIALFYGQSLMALLVLVLIAITSAVLTILSGIAWLQIWQREWIESQAVGFIFVPIILPFYAYTGAIAGSVLVSLLYRYEDKSLLSPVSQIIALGFTVVLSGLIPAVVISIPSFARPVPSPSGKVSQLVAVLIFAIFIGVMSAWLGSEFTHLLKSRS
jgi:hypothetical protein